MKAARRVAWEREDYAMLRSVFGLLFFLAQPVFADPLLECSDAGSQVEVGECVAKDEERVEAALAAALGFAMDAAEELDKATGRSAAACRRAACAPGVPGGWDRIVPGR